MFSSSLKLSPECIWNGLSGVSFVNEILAFWWSVLTLQCLGLSMFYAFYGNCLGRCCPFMTVSSESEAERQARRTVSLRCWQAHRHLRQLKKQWDWAGGGWLRGVRFWQGAWPKNKPTAMEGRAEAVSFSPWEENARTEAMLRTGAAHEQHLALCPSILNNWITE